MTSKRILLAILLCLTAIAPALKAQIKPGQGIQITITGVPSDEKSRFDGMYSVSDRGFISVPMVGKIRAAGLKAEELAESLQRHYIEGQIYTHPTFQVFDSDQKQIEQQLVIVGGFVRRPGPVNYIRDMTLWQAIQSAGGANEFGSMNRVELTRQGVVTEYDLSKPEQQQVRVRPSDAINVPQKNWIGG